LEETVKSLSEEVRELRSMHEILKTSLERKKMYDETKTGYTVFLVQDFLNFLRTEFQEQIRLASKDYAWVQQIR
jgi:hypothetical protein